MKRRGTPDFFLLILTLILVGIGIIMVSSASYYVGYYNGDENQFLKKQIIWATLGFISMIFMMNLPMGFFKRNYHLLALLSFLGLFLVWVPGLGVKANGAQSWIKLGDLGQLQPSEFAKLGIILFLAGYISKKQERIRDFKNGFLPPLVTIILFSAVIALQPDYGTAAILFGIAVVMLYTGGVQFKHLVGAVGAIALVAVPAALSEGYRLQRVLSFRDPWNDGLNGLGDGYQLIHSYYALSHGEWTGVGLFRSIEKALYLPHPHTDFIYSIIGEEFGFLGTSLVILLFLIFIWRALKIANRSDDLFCQMLGIGFVFYIAIQAFINIGGVVGLIPITGVPLPFISYGGSSILVTMTAVGILLNASRQRSVKIDETKTTSVQKKQAF